jgi:hypothetical protein
LLVTDFDGLSVEDVIRFFVEGYWIRGGATATAGGGGGGSGACGELLLDLKRIGFENHSTLHVYAG